MVERRPSARIIPTGIDATMPVTETTSVTSSPPHERVSTMGRPPLSRPITTITAAIPAKIAMLLNSARQPLRNPPVRKNISNETMIAVAARSVHSGDWKRSM